MALTVLSWLYTLLVIAVLSLHLVVPEAMDFLSSWCALPLQVLAIVLGGYLLIRKGLVKPAQRLVWMLLLVFTALNALATYFWNTSRNYSQRELTNFSDVLYLLDYWVLIAVFALLFIRAGGSFRTARVWLDAIIMLAVQLVGVWSFFLAPATTFDGALSISLSAKVAYAVTLASLTTVCALVCLQLPSYRGRYGMFLLFGAAASVVGSEVSWLSSWLNGANSTGFFYNYGDLLCMACLLSAATAAQFQPPLQSSAVNTEKQAFSFIPALAVLLAIACVAGSSISAGRSDAWILFGLAAVCVQLLATRQASMRRELHDLNQQLAMRSADARLTELARRSHDLLMVIDKSGMVSFASPAIEDMLGQASAKVQGTPADNLFGPMQQTALGQFLQSATAGADAQPTIELRMHHREKGLRSLRLSASDQRRNPLINGIVLTVHDITAQRAMEREILDVATRERIRLCADVHDGLGQELTGIALMLRTAAVAPEPDEGRQREQLESIVGLINRAIGTTRNLAHGYSPLHVVRGSLSSALKSLSQQALLGLPVSLYIDRRMDEQQIDDVVADNLYRIALEALTNAQRHSGATHIAIELRWQPDGLVLSVADDGTGIEGAWSDHHGLGLRLMTYRAELIGGRLRNAAPSGHGACIEVTVPWPSRK